jgi:hypothetical protein
MGNWRHASRLRLKRLRAEFALEIDALTLIVAGNF